MPAQTYRIVAYNVARELPLGLIEKKQELGLLTKRRNFLLYRPDPDRAVYIYAFGVIVVFNFPLREGQKLVKKISRSGIEPVEHQNVEEYEVIVDPERKPETGFDSVVLPRLDNDHLQIVSEVLAQSAAMDYVEELVERIVDRFKAIHADLERDGAIRTRDVELRKTIGAGRTITQYVITQLAVLDKPDIAWEEKEAEGLFMGLRKMFELEDRFRALEFRLDFLEESSQMLIEFVHTRRSYLLELSIVALFVIDIVLVLYEVFLGG